MLKSYQLVHDLAIPTHRYLRHFQVPQFADYEPLRHILATTSKTRCRKSAPICILLGANKKFSTAQKEIFYVFRRHPRQKRPRSHHYGFCVGVLWRTCVLRCLQQRPQPGWIPAGVRPGATGALSVLGPGAFFAVISSRFPTRDVLRDKLTR